MPRFWRPELACWKCEKACVGVAELEDCLLKFHSEGGFRTEDQLAMWMDTMKAILELEASWFALSLELLLWKVREELVRQDSFGESPLRVVFLEWLYNLYQGDGDADTTTSGGVSLLGADVGYPEVSPKSVG